MSGAGDEELDFERMMASDGVRAYGASKGGRKPGQAAAKPAEPARAAPPPAAPAAPKPPPLPKPDPMGPELVRLNRRVAELSADLVEANQRIDTLTREREGVDKARRKAAAELEETRTMLALATVAEPIADVLTARGLTGDAEGAAALRGLLELRAGDVLAALSLSDTDGLRALLDDRLALVCDGPACQADASAFAMHVPPGRCDVCGGSDIRAAWSRFVDACDRQAVRAVTFVGGSPNYRRQVKELSAGAKLEIKLVPGSVRRPKHKADADMRKADVVVIWGSTILDHSISENYRPDAGKARLVPVNVRGISRMLDQVRRAVLGV